MQPWYIKDLWQYKLTHKALNSPSCGPFMAQILYHKTCSTASFSLRWIWKVSAVRRRSHWICITRQLSVETHGTFYSDKSQGQHYCNILKPLLISVTVLLLASLQLWTQPRRFLRYRCLCTALQYILQLHHKQKRYVWKSLLIFFFPK